MSPCDTSYFPPPIPMARVKVSELRESLRIAGLLLDASMDVWPLLQRYAMNSPTLEPTADVLLPNFRAAIDAAQRARPPIK